MTGFRDEISGQIKHSIGVYYVGLGQEVGEFSDFSFLKKENFDAFIQKVKC